MPALSIGALFCNRKENTFLKIFFVAFFSKTLISPSRIIFSVNCSARLKTVNHRNAFLSPSFYQNKKTKNKRLPFHFLLTLGFLISSTVVNPSEAVVCIVVLSPDHRRWEASQTEKCSPPSCRIFTRRQAMRVIMDLKMIRCTNQIIPIAEETKVLFGVYHQERLEFVQRKQFCSWYYSPWTKSTVFRSPRCRMQTSHWQSLPFFFFVFVFSVHLPKELRYYNASCQMCSQVLDKNLKVIIFS